MNASDRLFFSASFVARRVVFGLVLVSVLASSLTVVAQERRVRSHRRYDPSMSVASMNGVVFAEGSQSPIVSTTSKYTVGVKEVRWNSKSGASYSASTYYPTTPPRNGSGFPVIIFSHGLGSSAENFAYLANSWASDGAVVICLRHPGSDESIWRGKLRAMSELREAYQRYWTGRDRAKAISSAIDFVYASHGSAGPMGADVDLARIGVAGNDLGALASFLVAGQLPPDNGVSLKDPRVAAVLALSPPVFCEAERGASVYASVEAPTMVVTGTEDDGIVGNTKAFQRRIPYDSVRLNDRYLVVLQGGDHRVYAGHRMASKQAHDAPYQETIRVATTEFWRAYLHGQAPALNDMRSGSFASKFFNAAVEAKRVEFSVKPAAVGAVQVDGAVFQAVETLKSSSEVGEFEIEGANPCSADAL